MRWPARCLMGWVLAFVGTAPVFSQTFQSREAAKAWLPVSGTDGDLLIVPAIINGRSAKAMVDSGVVGVMLNKAFADRERMPLTQIGMAQDLGGRQPRYTVPHFQLTIDGIVGPDAPVQVSDLTRLEQASGSRIDVVVGASFIAAYGLEVDFDNRRLRFEAPGEVESSQFRVPLSYDSKNFIISANIGRNATPLYLDLGSNGGVRLTGANADDIIGVRPLTDVQSVGAGGREVTELATLSNFTVGSANFGTVEVQLAPEGDSDRSAVLGSLGLGVLGRYNLGINARYGIMTLSPRSKTFYITPKSTIGLQFSHESDKIVVMHVMKNSPAEVSGFRQGDYICAVNGENVDYSWNSKPISKWSTAVSGKEFIVKLCSGKTINVKSKNFY